MPSRKLLGVYALSTVLLLAAGILSLTLSLVWRGSNPLRNLIFTSTDLSIGTAIGVLYLVTVVVSVAAIIQPVHVTLGLKILNWILVTDATVTVALGTVIWFFTLQERKNYLELFSHLSTANMAAVQDQLQCCGYFTSTDVVAATGFCQAPANGTQFCVGPVTAAADYALNNVFSTVYGFMAVLASLFLASMCVINKRDEGERFRKIDEKRGGQGFV